MRLEVLTDAALRQLKPSKLMELISAVQRLINTATAYQRRLIAVAEIHQAARATGDATVADSLVRTTGMSRRDARRAGPRHARTVARVTPSIYDCLMNIKTCATGLGYLDRHRCHTPSLRWSHAT